MTISTVPTNSELKRIVECSSDDLVMRVMKVLAAELLAVREAQPVEDEIYAELYRLRIENKGPDGFETWRDAAVFERTRRADAERKLSGEEMTYLEAMSLLTAEDAQNLSAIEAFRRGANYNGKINAHALRNSMRYQYLRDKDAFGEENEPGLAGWDELIELEGNEFDAAIDARMAHPDIAYTAPPTVPADVAAALDWIDDFIARCNGDDRGAYNSVNVLRAAMLQPVSQGYTFDGLNIRAVAALRESVRNQWLKSEGFADKIYWKNMHSIANEIIEAMAAAPTPTRE